MKEVVESEMVAVTQQDGKLRPGGRSRAAVATRLAGHSKYSRFEAEVSTRHNDNTYTTSSSCCSDGKLLHLCTASALEAAAAAVGIPGLCTNSHLSAALPFPAGECHAEGQQHLL